MAINLNLAKYGDQFKAFENFARENANNMDALARIGGDGLEGALLAPDGKPRAIVAKTDDDKIKRFKQNLFFSRNADQKALNTAVRKLFLDTVLKICGVEKVKDLPPAVRKRGRLWQRRPSALRPPNPSRDGGDSRRGRRADTHFRESGK